MTFSCVLDSNKRDIHAFYDHRISSGPLEGTKNKIKTLYRQAFGCRGGTFFTLPIYALHTSKYEPVGGDPGV